MRKFTRTLSCTLIAALLLTVAATDAACGKRAEYPTVSEVTGSQAAGEVIPAVDRQEQFAAAKNANPAAETWLFLFFILVLVEKEDKGQYHLSAGDETDGFLLDYDGCLFFADKRCLSNDFAVD